MTASKDGQGLLKGSAKWWMLWVLLTVGGGVYLGTELFISEQKALFLPGQTTHGHHQIEMQCTVCHADGFNSEVVLQDACMNCHGDELDDAQDSHPRSKFTNPRNAELLNHLDARQCVACHVEHRPELITTMGVSQPINVCVHCHTDIGEDRPSHQGMEFNTCQSAGCHNFHDNRALYEDFLLAHADEPKTLSEPVRPLRNFSARYFDKSGLAERLTAEQILSRAPVIKQPIPENWVHSSHAAAAIECKDCHGNEASWKEKPEHTVCESCHENEVSTFLQGKHGMRLAQGLSPMTPAQSELNIHVEKSHQELTCNTCHTSHDFDTRKAAVDKCIGCHNDEHSNEYLRSPHYTLWRKELKGEAAPGTGVSCATCHMPATRKGSGSKERIFVDHNQNANLRPNEKMIRSVCMNCHGLGFSIDALADPVLVEHNFPGDPSVHIESIDMAVERDEKRGKRESIYD